MYIFCPQGGEAKLSTPWVWASNSDFLPTSVVWRGEVVTLQRRDTEVKNRLLDSVGEGKGGMIWETGIETCILSYMK